MKKNEQRMTLRQLAPDFDRCLEDWMGTKEDREYGKKLLPFMEAFLNDLISRNLSRRTLMNYINDVGLLGRSIITQVSNEEEHDVPVREMLMQSVETGGMLPDGYSDMTEEDLRTFERTCKKFEKFLTGSA